MTETFNFMRQPTEEEIEFTLNRVRALSEGRLKIKTPNRRTPIALIAKLKEGIESVTLEFEGIKKSDDGIINAKFKPLIVRPPGKPENARVTGHCARCPACDRAVVTRATPKGPIFGLHRETIESSSPHCHKSFKLVEENQTES